ncbi:MAG: sigma-54-dependent Fis family transcriptional regulator [Acidobacteriota bacterium]
MADADLAQRCRDLEGLRDLAGDLLQVEEYDEMLDVLMTRALALLGGERGFVVLRSDGPHRPRVVKNWTADDLQDGEEPISRSIVAEVLASARPILVRDALFDPRFGAMASVQELSVRSVLAAPLTLDGTIAGALYIERRAPDRFFGERELALFESILALSSRALQIGTKLLLLRERNAALEARAGSDGVAGIVTRDPALLKILESLPSLGASDMPVLVQGASGTGKELVVRAIQRLSPRASHPFLTVNCAAISAGLLESELFGHVKGAFTGAIQDKAGLVPSAHGGTLFLDEIGEMPRDLQGKLLRTLQFGEVAPVGSASTRHVDVRFLAATNRDLDADVRAGRFREDLYYRLSGLVVHLPRLADRRGDVLVLFHHFLSEAANRASRPLPEVSPRLERIVESYDWPGNVRDLENEARRLIALTPAGVPLTADRLSPRILAAQPRAAETPASLAETERELVELHLRLAGGNRTQAARSLGITREGLRKKLRRLGL